MLTAPFVPSWQKGSLGVDILMSGSLPIDVWNLATACLRQFL